MKTGGSCLCGDVAFAIDGELSEIEICHCPRCRKAFGSTFAATLYVRAADFAWTRGSDKTQRYEAPIVSEPPAYGHVFCGRCGSPLPIEIPALGLVELPAAVLDDDIASRPQYHMFVTKKAPWHEIADGLPQHETSPTAEKVLIPLLKREGE
jgi:hypothetical protein